MRAWNRGKELSLALKAAQCSEAKPRLSLYIWIGLKITKKIDILQQNSTKHNSNSNNLGTQILQTNVWKT